VDERSDGGLAPAARLTHAVPCDAIPAPMPPAARVGDKHDCPVPLHADGPILPRGCPTVLIDWKPAARVGDEAGCGAARDAIVMGEASVLVGDRMAARVGDPHDHGGVIVEGCATVFIGSSAQSGVMREAARRGAPLVEECPHADAGWRAQPEQLDCLREAARRGTPLVEECPAARRPS
jgi:uncharacterized Zn-binding protein involved in type VI secretion